MKTNLNSTGFFLILHCLTMLSRSWFNRQTRQVICDAKRGTPGGRYDKGMEKVVRIFNAFDAADAADAEEDRNMTPERRVAMVLELRERLYPDAAQQGLARVCRVIELNGS